MRATVLVGVTLTMLMLLLVMIAAFIFLYQGRQALVAQRTELQQTVEQAERQEAAGRSTREALAMLLATVEAEAVLLEGQLVDSQQEADVLARQLSQINATVEALQREQQERLQEGTVVEVVRPQPETLLQAGTPVDIVVVVADPEGVTGVTLAVAGDLIGNYVASERPLVTVTESWTPPRGGQYEMRVQASNGRAETVFTTTLSAVAPASQFSTLAADPNSLLRVQIEQNVSEVRGLLPLTPITTTVLTTAELAQRMVITPTAVALLQEARLWQSFDFAPPELDAVTTAQTGTMSAPVSYYDAETKEMLVAGDAPALTPSQQLAYVREVVRFLLDQHFGLSEVTDGRLENGRSPNDFLLDDAKLAAAALAEGDAALVQNLYLRGDYFTQQELNTLLAALGEQQTANASDDPDAPALWQQQRTFRQETGLAFVQALYQQNGDFTAVNAAWNDLPRSTEQLLHLSRYEEQDAPRPVTAPALPADEWTFVADGTLGEFLLRAHLRQQLNADQVETAAAGWGGDRYALYQRQTDGALLLVWRLLWDTLDDSIQFAALYPNYPTRLFGVSGEIQPDGSECWQGEVTICLWQRNDETVVMRAPDLVTATAVLSEISGP